MSRFATLQFERQVAAPLATLWHIWTAPAARALWSAPSDAVTVEFLEVDPRPGGREVSLCKVAGQPDIRCDVGWLVMEPEQRSLNTELISREGEMMSAALVTMDLIAAGAEASRLAVTVQLSGLAEDMTAGYRMGFDAGLANLAGIAERSMVISRVIAAPRAEVFGTWINAATLPQWWGPKGFSCHTKRIELRPGGDWVFDMIGPDGTVFPNHHHYTEILPGTRIVYRLHWGENGPKHADAWASFTDEPGGTRVTLAMVFASAAECREAKGFGAEALGLQTLGKLAAFIGVA